MDPLPAPYRIVTSNLTLPQNLDNVGNAEPAVQVLREEVPRVSELSGQAARRTVFTHETVPTSNFGLDITAREIPGGGISLPHGANIRYNELAPGGRVPMHRSGTTDYNIFLHGSVILITPDEAFDPALGRGALKETICNPGDVVMQRGTLHAQVPSEYFHIWPSWENRSTEWVRFIAVILGAEPTAVERSDGTSQPLADCFGDYDANTR
ncbi:hypothetical protein BX600DRAFT_554870 [Xylariales sp. PMI_506]|nr:hypothetical protein BX600DRAFT_554870 [Xylariales sp. PMI_506]